MKGIESNTVVFWCAGYQLAKCFGMHIVRSQFQCRCPVAFAGAKRQWNQLDLRKSCEPWLYFGVRNIKAGSCSPCVSVTENNDE